MTANYVVKTLGPAHAGIAVVEIRTAATVRQPCVAPGVAQLLEATCLDLGIKYDEMRIISIQFLGISKVPHATALDAVRKEVGRHDLIITIGADAMRAMCRTTRSINEYAGSLTWHTRLQTWVLPTHHPGRVEAGEYHVFDAIYDHFKRAARLLDGRIPFPPNGGYKVDWTFLGHNGTRGPDRRWSGYDECTEEHVTQARQVFRQWLTELDSSESTKLFALDTETTSADFYNPVIMIQIYDGKKAYAFNRGVYEDPRVLPNLQELLAHPSARWAMHNMAYDRKKLRESLGVDFGERDTDTMCYGLALTEKGAQTGLKYLSRQWCNAPFYEEALDEWLDKSDVDYAHIRPDVLAEYGCSDVFYTYQLCGVLPDLVRDDGGERSEWLLDNVLLPAQRMFSENEGIRVDEAQIKALEESWEPRIEAAIKQVQKYAASMGFPKDPKITDSQATKAPCSCVPIRLTYHLAGLRVLSWGKFLRESHDFNEACTLCNNKRYIKKRDDTLNVRSPIQMQHLCFDILGMNQTYEGRKTNKLFWAYNESHEFAKLVMAYREIDYLHTHFVVGLRKHIMPDGRVHPTFLLFGTKTGRLAIKNPAMQTIPSRSITPDAKAVKKIFIPEDGYVVIDIDYKNLEMFMNQHLTKDPVLLEDLTTKDIYRANAADMFARTYELVTDEERQNSKTVVLSAGYGIGAKKLANTTLREVAHGNNEITQGFLDSFWTRYTVWSEELAAWRDTVAEVGELTTWFGRKRRWPFLCDGNWWKIRNQAGNFPGQSMASDLCLTSLIKIHKELKTRGWGKVWMSVHDSIVVEVKKEVVHEAVILLESIMSSPPFPTDTPFMVDTKVGPSYGEVTKYRADEHVS